MAGGSGDSREHYLRLLWMPFEYWHPLVWEALRRRRTRAEVRYNITDSIRKIKNEPVGDPLSYLPRATEGTRMRNGKIKLEIYEGDPFEGSCCGPARASEQSVEELRRMLTKRNETVKRLEQKFQGIIEVSRDVISSRRGLMSYPEHVRDALSQKGRNALPYVFIEGRLLTAGNFPSYDEFLALLNPYTKK